MSVANDSRLQIDLERRIGALGSVIVAFSGGVDSSVVAALSARALGARALAITALSPALASGELDGARAVAAAAGIDHETIATDELASADYRRNDRFRCFHCKHELYGRLSALARERGYAAVLSGANADDAGDWRPGLRAAADHGVLHPLLEAGAGKAQVRALARAFDLPSAEKPASPCLASRIPYGTPVEPATLARIDRAEQAVRELGYRVLRVRHHGETSAASSLPATSWMGCSPTNTARTPSRARSRPPATPAPRSTRAHSAPARSTRWAREGPLRLRRERPRRGAPRRAHDGRRADPSPRRTPTSSPSCAARCAPRSADRRCASWRAPASASQSRSATARAPSRARS